MNIRAITSRGLNLKSMIVAVVSALILTMISTSPASAATINIACSGGGTFTHDTTTNIVSAANNCKGDVIIPEGVVSIAGRAFDKTRNPGTLIRSVVIPSTVTSIGYGGFRNQESLTSLTIPNSVTTISDYAFANATKLVNLTIGTGLSAIASSVFEGASSLQTLSIPRNVTTIGAKAFFGATSLTTVRIPSTTTNIGDYAFQNTSSLTKIYFSGAPPAVIGNDVFLNTSVNATVYVLSAQVSNFTLITNQKWNGLSVAVSPAPITIDAAISSPYVGQPDTLTATVTAGDTGTVTFKNGSGGILCSGTLNGSGVATCVWIPDVNGSVAVSGHYSEDSINSTAISSAITLLVLAEPSITNFTIPQLSYGTPETLSATSSVGGKITFLKDGLAITNCVDIFTDGSNTAMCTFTPSDLATASYTLNFTPTSTGYTNLVGVNSLSVTATKAILLVQPLSASVSYGGTPSYSLTYAGFVKNETVTSTSFTTGLTPPTCVAASYTTSTSVSSSPLSITCSGGTSTNYTFSYTSTANLTISRATPSLSLALSAATPIYGTIDSITATASVPGVIDFKVGGSTISGCGAVSTATSSPYTAQCPWIPGAASTAYSLTASLSPTNSVDYTSTNSATTTTSSSSRAAITVTPTASQSKNYGANDPVIAYSITSGTLIGSDVLSGALTYTGTNVGSYPITIGTLANSSYTITLASVNFAITRATQAAVTLSSLSSAYNPSNKTVSLTGSGGSGTGTFQYALDASNTTAGCSVNASTLTYTTAGTCIVAVTRTSDTNYLARTDVVSFSIGLASQTISFASLSAKSYSSDTFTVSATSSASLTVTFTSGSPTICTTSGSSGSIITLLGVGTCVINANQSGDANTSAASQVSQNFTVNPRAITVTADANSKSHGAADPTFTYSITTGSLVLGDALTGSLTRTSGSDAGTYQIQQGTLTTANNPKYAITFVAADLTITRITPTLALTYPNSNVAILRPGATDTPTVTTSSSAGSLSFTTSATSSICTVNTSSGVISLFGAGSCPIAMTTAQTTNYIQHTETTTVTVALLSTSLTGINQSNLVSMGQPFYAHASIDQSYSFSSGSNGASIAIPAGALDASVPISIHLLADATDQRTLIGGSGTSVLSVVVSWVSSDGSVPSTNTGKAISVTLTNPAIKSGAKIYSIIGTQSTLLGTATADGSVTSLITEDPVLLVINPVVTTPAPTSSGSGYVMAVVVDNSAAIEAANLKLAADKAAAELKAAQEKAAAEAAEAIALEIAMKLADAQAQAAAELKASLDKAAEELRIAEALRITQLKSVEELKLAAEKKAASDLAAAARAGKPAVTLYSVSPALKLNSYDSAYLAKYVKSLKNGASVTCIGYTYGKSPASKASQTLAKRQANAVCTEMKSLNKSLKTLIVIYPATKAPKAATGAKWVGVSYRIDGFKR